LVHADETHWREDGTTCWLWYAGNESVAVFRMAPLHHHFELGGWDEEKITMRFWIVGALAGMLGVTLFVASIPNSIPK